MFAWIQKLLANTGWSNLPPIECHGARLHVLLGNEDLTIVHGRYASNIRIAASQHWSSTRGVEHETTLDNTTMVTIGAMSASPLSMVAHGAGHTPVVQRQRHVVDTTSTGKPAYCAQAHNPKLRVTINVPTGMIVLVERI